MGDVKAVQSICKVPSISLGVMHQGKVIFRESLGLRDVEDNLPADADTMYLLGSVSKVFLSAAAGIAVDEKRIKWNGRLSEYVDGFDPE